MHVAIAWDSKPLLLLTTALLSNRSIESFQMEAAGPPYDKQRIQMELRKGNTVLIPIILETERKEKYASYTAIKKNKIIQ